MSDQLQFRSKNGRRRVLVSRRSDGAYALRTFAMRHDPEESVDYEVEVLPAVSSLFADVDAASAAAKRLIAEGDTTESTKIL